MATRSEPPLQRLPRTVIALGWVSFFTDLGSEMIVPLLPAFLQAMGAGALFLGILEGVSQAVIAVLKGTAGWWSDRSRARKPWAVAGYGLSTLARPVLAVAGSPIAVLVIRVVDRVGKGIRSAPRDALIAAEVPPELRGRAFGLQRALDHAGALTGPLAAAGLLALGVPMRWVFALALVPGLVAVGVLWVGVRERPRADARTGPVEDRMSASMRALLVFTAASGFGRLLDLQLILRAAELGVPESFAPLLWVVLHAVRSSLSTPFGTWADRRGRRRALAVGAVVQAGVLLGFGLAAGPVAIWILFALYGLPTALCEGAERRLVADLAAGGRGGTAFGLYLHGRRAGGVPDVRGVRVAVPERGSARGVQRGRGCRAGGLAGAARRAGATDPRMTPIPLHGQGHPRSRGSGGSSPAAGVTAGPGVTAG